MGIVQVDVTTDTGLMHLDGDIEEQSGSDTNNKVSFNDGRTVTAKTLFTLDAATGSIEPDGLLTLKAGAGIVINDDMTSATAGKAVVIDADYESTGDGTLTVQTGEVITTNNSPLTITAWDLDLDGGVATGTENLFISGAQTSQTIGLGATSANMHIADQELQRMSADSGLTLGGSTTTAGSMTVNEITAAGSDNLKPLVSLVAQADTASITFATAGSTFNALAAQADDGVIVQVDVTTDTGL